MFFCTFLSIGQLICRLIISALVQTNIQCPLYIWDGDQYHTIIYGNVCFYKDSHFILQLFSYCTIISYTIKHYLLCFRCQYIVLVRICSCLSVQVRSKSKDYFLFLFIFSNFCAVRKAKQSDPLHFLLMVAVALIISYLKYLIKMWINCVLSLMIFDFLYAMCYNSVFISFLVNIKY